MTGASIILRSVGTFARSALKVSSGARTRGALGTETLYKIQCRQFRASIHFQSVAADITTSNWIAAILPRLRDWRTAIERTPTCALAVRRLIQQWR